MTKRRNVIVHIGTSADGYIARPDGDLEWLTSRPKPEGFYGMSAFMRSIDVKLLGRKTYEVSLRMGGEVRLEEESDHRFLSSCATSRRPVRRGVHKRCNRPIREPSSRAAWQGYLVDGRWRDHRLVSGCAGDRRIRHQCSPRFHWGRHPIDSAASSSRALGFVLH